MAKESDNGAAVRVADIVARTLRAHGVEHAFGIPGGEVLTLIDALKAAGIRFVLNRHETPAATMAAGVSTLTGAPGVLVTTVGPGLANAVNAIVDASQERVPLLIISGVVDHAIRHRYTHQVLDQAALLRGAVKASFEVEAEGAGATMARAIELAMTPPCGPVHIDLAPGTAALMAHVEDRTRVPAELRALTPAAGDPAIAEFADALSKAQRPLVIAGFEAARAAAGPQLLALFGQLGAPLITTYKGKGVVDERHPLCLGGAGLSPLSDGPLLEIVRAADAVLLAGYDPIEMRQGWLEPFAAVQTVLEICEHPYDHGMHRADRRLLAPVGGALDVLGKTLRRDTDTWPLGEPAAARARLKDLFSAPEPWGPHAVIDTLEETLGDEARCTVDSGAHRILLSQKMQIRRPLGLLQSAGFCTMGVALPLAAGVKIAEPAGTVVAVLGDGGLEMGLGELATLRDERINIIIVVLQDESLALIELKQKAMAYERQAVGLGLTRFEDIAAAFGGHGERVSDKASLAKALRSAMQRDRFSLIVCPIQASQYVKRI